MFETALKKGELIETIEFEIPEKSNYAKISKSSFKICIVGVYIAKLKKGTELQ